MASPTLIVQQLINGLLFGGILALIAVGLTLIWGVTRILNFAHGAMIMFGGYVGLVAYGATGSVVVMILSTIVVLFVMGVAMEWYVVDVVRGRDNSEIAAIIGTFAIAIMLEYGVRVVFGASHRSLPTLIPGTTDIGPITLVNERLMLFALAMIALGILFAVIKYTKLGLAMRAVAQDRDAALLMGVQTKYVFGFTFGIAAAMAGLAGVLIAPIFNIYPAVGWRPFLFAFIVVIIGGLGSVRGTLVAALLIGVIRSLSLTWTSAQATQIILFLVMIAVLILRPSGIAGVVSE